MKPAKCKIIVGDCRQTLRSLPDCSVQCCVTSPPYFGLRDYGIDDQIGLEQTPEAFVAELAAVFQEVKRVLRDDGTLWLNLGDTYAGYHGNKNADYDSAPSNKNGYFENQRLSLVNHNGIKNKDMIGIPWRVAFALQSDGWYLRQDIIWHKPNPMPESVTDRCTKAHEYVFLLSKSQRYFFNAGAIKEPCSEDMQRRAALCHTRGGNGKVDASRNDEASLRGEHSKKITADDRNRRSVWTVPTYPYADAHFATYPPDLIKPCIMAGSRPGDTVLDPFGGSGTTGMVALELGRNAILCELNPQYAKLAEKRTHVTPGFAF